MKSSGIGRNSAVIPALLYGAELSFISTFERAECLRNSKQNITKQRQGLEEKNPNYF